MYTKLSLRSQMKVSRQLVITGKLLQVPGSELELFIDNELANNPALEYASKSDSMKANPQFASAGSLSSRSAHFAIAGSHSISSEDMIENLAQRKSPLDRLAEQAFLTLEKDDHDITIHLIHCLDDRGFLVIPTDQLAAELGVSTDTIVRVIQILHQLEPPGVGARDLRECFLIQCAHLESEGKDCQEVRRILTLAWSEFLNQEWDRVARKIQRSKKIVQEACEFMRLNLDPHPLAILEASDDITTSLNHADLIIRRDHYTNSAAYLLEIPGEEDFKLKMSLSFQKLLGCEAQGDYQLSPQDKTWIGTHLDRAALIIAALRQRWETLRRIGEYLIQYQHDFLEHGSLYLKPLTRAIVAQQLDLHESTISRAVSNKTVQLPNGRLMPLGNFFDPSLAAKEAIRLLVRNNSKSLCDREIAQDLQTKGIKLSRRTVSKYRREININSSRQLSIAI